MGMLIPLSAPCKTHLFYFQPTGNVGSLHGKIEIFIRYAQIATHPLFLLTLMSLQALKGLPSHFLTH